MASDDGRDTAGGDWKILAHLSRQDVKPGGGIRAEDRQAIKTAELARFELYDLRQDVAQENDRSEQEPERLKEMA